MQEEQRHAGDARRPCPGRLQLAPHRLAGAAGEHRVRAAAQRPGLERRAEWRPTATRSDAHRGGGREARREAVDVGVELIGGQREVGLKASVAATPKSLTDSAKPIASADQMAGARIGRMSRRDASAGGAVDPGRVLELLPETGQRGGDREVGERAHERSPSSSTTPKGPMISVCEEQRVEPHRYKHPVGQDEPLPAERRQPGRQQQDQPHAGGDEPPPRQRGAGRPARRSGTRSTSPSRRRPHSPTAS